MNYTEVWNIATQKLNNDFFILLLVVGVLFIIIESIALFARKKWGENSIIFKLINSISKPRYPASKIFIPIGIILIIISGVVFSISSYRQSRIVNELNSDQIVVIEGLVDVEFEQPESGHTGGDIVHINNYTFKINYFFKTHYYNQSIAHGGFLRQGKYVRICFIPTTDEEKWTFGDGKILKIERKITSK